MYIGNDLQIAHPSYKIIDDISSGFNGSTTSFALQVSGATPVPFPISTQQVMISVNGVIQEPDPTGSAGFKLLGSNIVFSSAPGNGESFFGVINAGADYVTAGSEFPDGSATAPSFTFQDDQDTGWFRSGSGAVGYSANGAQTLTFDGNGLTVTGDASFVGASSKNLLWDNSDGQLEFADNAKAIFGTGSDLKIWHDGTNSVITNATGDLYINNNADTIIKPANDCFIKPQDGENGISVIGNGAVELYYDNVKTFKTISEGARVLGNEGASAVLEIWADQGDDNADKWRLVSDQSSNYFYLQNYAAGSFETSIRALGNGNVELYHNNNKRLETTAGGATLSGNLVLANSTQSKFILDTADGSDNKWLNINGGGDASQSRGGGIMLGGNEYSGNEGRVWLLAGNSGNTNGTIDFSTGGSVIGRFDSSGRLLLGTTTEGNDGADDLTIATAAHTGITIRSGTGSQGNIYFSDGTSGGDEYKGIVRYNHSDDAMTIRTNATVALTLDSSQNATFAGRVNLAHDLTITGTAPRVILTDSNNDSDFRINVDGGSFQIQDATNSYANRLAIDSSGNSVFGGTVSDSKGDLRKIPQNSQSSAYTLVNSDGGKHILASGNIVWVDGRHAAGDAITIVNNTGGDITITKGTTMYNTADGSNANRTLATRGMATILWVSGTVAYISGAGLS